jgi:hypothetical protein
MILLDTELLARERQTALRRAADEARQARLAEGRAHGTNRPGLRLPLALLRRR